MIKHGRLIDADALLKELEEANIVSFYELNEHSNEAYREFKFLIEHVPTIEPEIIHCQGCKHAKENQGELWICTHPDNNAWRITKDFYCGRAERREK